MRRSRWFVSLLALSLALVWYSTVEAQVDSLIGSYTFANLAPGTYSELSGDTPFAVDGGGGTLDDGISADQTVPFPFKFGGMEFTTYRVNTNGWLGFGSPTTTANYYPLSGSVNNVIAFCARDLNNTIDAVYSNVTDGVAPHRVHKIQAKGFYRYNNSTMSGNAQVWLYEGSNVVEIRFGAFAQTWFTGTTVQVGLRGPGTGTAYLASLTGSGVNTWTDPVAGHSSTSTMELAGTVSPDSGRTYVFTPVVAPIGSYTFANLAPGSYSDLTGDTPFAVDGGGGTLDDGISADQTIPFPFNFGGPVFTTYRVDTNGWLGFGSPTTTANYYPLSGSVNNVIAFCGRDLNNTIGAVYSNVTDGVAPRRVHKIQAKGFYRYNNSTMSGNAQVWLHEGSNVVEIRYGDFAQTWFAGTTVQVGLRGASTGTADVASLSGSAFDTWTRPLAGSSSTSTMELAETVTPDSGRTYVFTPLPALVFEDGFESGTTDGWGSVAPSESF